MWVHASFWKVFEILSLFWDVQSEQTLPFYLSWRAQGSNSELTSASGHVRGILLLIKNIGLLVASLTESHEASNRIALTSLHVTSFLSLLSFTQSVSECQFWSGHIVMVDDTQATGCFPGAARLCQTFHSSEILWIWATFELHPSIHITSYSTYIYEVLLWARHSSRFEEQSSEPDGWKSLYSWSLHGGEGDSCRNKYINK